MRLLIIGGSDAGISAALRARELRPDVEITVLLADAFPNYSICGLPFYVSGETEDWHQLAHRTEFPASRSSAIIEPRRWSLSVRLSRSVRLPVSRRRRSTTS